MDANTTNAIIDQSLPNQEFQTSTSRSCLDITRNLTDSIESLGNKISTTSTSITEPLGGMSSDIASSINNLTTELSNVIVSSNDGATLEKLIFAIFVTFTGALSAYFFNLLHWKIIQQRQNASSIGNSLIVLIEKLESLAIEYWVNEYNRDKSETYHISEIQIKTTLRQINKYTSEFSGSLKGKKASIKNSQLNSFVSEIYDLVTGDGFESTSRQSSKPKAMKIARECSDARLIVFSTITRI